MTKFIVIASGKGGVGKTTTAINLGTALTLFSRDVVVVDANLKTPHITLYLGAPTVPITLHDVLEHNKNISEALYQHRHGLKIIPAGISYKHAKNDVSHDKIKSLISELSGKTDFVIIDTPPGLSRDAIDAIKLGDEILVVSTPDLASVSDALKLIKFAKEHKKKVTGVILTRAYEDELELSKEDVEAMLETEVIAIIPEDETMREAVMMKTPIVHSHPNAPSSLKYKELASKLLGEKYVESIEKKDTLFDYIMKRIGLK